jgi:hypothetical protein
MQFKKFMEALKGNQHTLDKNKNGKLDADDFQKLRKTNEEYEEIMQALDEALSTVDKGEYDYEGAMARTQLQTICRNAEDLIDMVKMDENMPEWVQSKITLAQDYISSVRDYLQSRKELGEGKTPGLWDNIHAKRERIKAGSGEKMRKPGSNGAPTDAAFKASQNEELVVEESDAYAKSEENKRSADAAKKQGDMFAHHLHMADHHENLAQWHGEKGRHSTADSHAEKAEKHHELAMQHKMKKEETELDEATPYYNKPSWIKKMSQAAKQERLAREKKEKEAKPQVKEQSELEEGEERMDRSDYKVSPSGRKTHKQITFKDGSTTGNEKEDEMKEEKMSDADMKERERIVKGMKKNISGFKAKYGERAKEVMYATATKMAMKEESELEEQAPVAPSLMKHRISVTVSDPDHTMVSKRKEKIQKTVIVTHSDNKQGAQKVGEKFYKKKGYVVHDSHHAGMVNEEKLEEALDPSEIAGNPKMYDASTVKKAYYHKSTSASDKESLASHLDRHHGNKEWRKPVKEELDEKFINGREYASHGLMHPDHAAHAVHKVTGQSIDFYAHGTGDKVEGKVTKNDGKSVHIKDTKGTTHKFKVQRGLPQQKNEELNFDEQGNLMAEKLKFNDFIAKMNEQLLEYESDSSGVYRHTKKATYGTSYQGDDDEDEKPKKAAAPDAPKRGRGRPAGSTGASYKPRSAATAAAAKAKAAATKAANKNK